MWHVAPAKFEYLSLIGQHNTNVSDHVTPKICPQDFTGYSSVPNRRVGRNKRAGGKILKKH